MNERELYRSQVALLIDITYLPILGREESLRNINQHLIEMKKMIERTVPGIKVIHKPEVWKLMCTLSMATVKIEVNGTKRGVIEPPTDMMLCEKAQQEFSMGCALSRQHPRDLFDCKYMEVSDFAQIRKGLILCLLGSDKPIVESLVPNSIDQTEALEKHFQGMSEVEFSYADYEASRQELQRWVNNGLTLADKEFLISFERGEPDWALCDAGDLSIFPSVQWKLKNILKLKESNPKKFEKGIQLITDLFSL